MAKLTKSYENGVEQIALYFRNKVFTLTSSRCEEDGEFVTKEKCFYIQAEEAFSDDDDVEEIIEIIEIIDDLIWEGDILEILDLLEQLENFE